MKYPHFAKKKELSLHTPQQSSQVSPGAVWLQVGHGEGEEDKAVPGCTLVSGTWKKCGGCRRMENLPRWEFPLNPGQM